MLFISMQNILTNLLLSYYLILVIVGVVIVNTRAMAGTQHTLSCMIENFNSSKIPFLYTWSIATCTSEQCVIEDVQFTDARTDYRCEVRRHDDNTVIAISDNTSLEVSSKLSIIYSIIIVYSYIHAVNILDVCSSSITTAVSRNNHHARPLCWFKCDLQVSLEPP